MGGCRGAGGMEMVMDGNEGRGTFLKMIYEWVTQTRIEHIFMYMCVSGVDV